MFGTGRGLGYEDEILEKEIHVFWIDLDANGDPRNNFQSSEFDDADFNDNSYVVAIKPELVNGDEIHMILRMRDDSNNYNLYYFVASRQSRDREIPAIELYARSDRMWTYATFIGTKTKTGISNDFDMYQGYIAGSRIVIRDWRDYFKWVDSVMPIILDDAESCDTYPNDDHNVRLHSRDNDN